MTRLLEFLEDDASKLSLSRLLSFLSFWPSSWVLLRMPTEGMLGIYLTAYGVAYLGGKGLDAMTANGAARAARGEEAKSQKTTARRAEGAEK